MMQPIELTFFIDVLSSWCLVAEPALERVRSELGDQLAYQWRIAALREALDYTPEQLAFYYERTHFVSGVRLNPIWLESTADGSKWANLAAEAARSLGCTDDRVRLALARAAMIEGKHVGQRPVALEVAAVAGGLDKAALGRAMDDPQTQSAIRESTADFLQYKVEMRPTFVLRNAIADTTVLSGTWRYDVLAQAIRAQIEDQERVRTFMATNSGPAGVV